MSNTSGNVLLASITSAYNHARANGNARFTLRVPAGTRELVVDTSDFAYFGRVQSDRVLTGLTLSKLESEYLKYDLRGVQLYLEGGAQ